MEKDCMGEEEDKSHREQEMIVENIGAQVCPTKIKQVRGVTQMWWMLIEEEKEIGYAMCVENRAIWPRIAGRDERRKDR